MLSSENIIIDIKYVVYFDHTTWQYILNACTKCGKNIKRTVVIYLMVICESYQSRMPIALYRCVILINENTATQLLSQLLWFRS